jgi:homeobox-leucine zipper protein
MCRTQWCFGFGSLTTSRTLAYAQVTWVEHMEVEEKSPINVLYRDLVLSGAAFGAHRWLAALQRACERYASLVALGVPHHIAGGMHPSSARHHSRRCVFLSP